MIKKPSAFPWLEIASANLAIGTASVFVIAVAIVSLAFDRGDFGLGLASDWSLRGTLAPVGQPWRAGNDGVSRPGGT